MKGPVKLLIGINDFRVGGAQKLVADIVKRLDREVFDITLVTLAKNEKEINFNETIPGWVRYEQIHFNSLYDLSAWIEIFKLVLSVKPDVVWSNLFLSNLIFRVSKLFFKYEVITVEHNIYVHKSWAHRFADRLLSKITYKIVAVSKNVLHYTAKTEHIPESKFLVISNGIDVDFFSSTNIEISTIKKELEFPEDSKIVISVGQLIKQKNHQLLIKAFADFIKIRPEYKLMIIGEGSSRELLEKEIKSLNLEQQVKLLGVRKNVADYYSVSDFFVLPSLFEGFALVCVEAMASGLPVISTKVAGPDEYIKDGKNGYFTENDSKDLCEKMTLLANLDMSDKLFFVRNAKETASLYSINETVKNYEKLFIEAAKRY